MSESPWGELTAIEASEPAAIVTVRLNRPKKINAINFALETELYRVLRACDADDRVKCVLLTANGANFSAGHDIEQVAEEAMTDKVPDEFNGRYWARTGELLPPWWLRKALVVAVKGFVGPHANTFLLAADAVIAADNTQFSWEETRTGIGAPFGPYALMPYHFPMRVVKQLWMPGGWMDAETALRLFYVNRVVPLGEEDAEARRFAEMYATMELGHLIANKQGTHKFYEAAGLLQMVGVGRDPYEPQGEAAEEFVDHLRTIHEEGAGAAARKRDAAFDRSVLKV